MGREVLVAHGADEAEEGGWADGGEARIAAGGPGASMLDGGVDLDAGGNSVGNDAAGDFFAGGKEGFQMGIAGGGEEGGGELTADRAEDLVDLLEIVAVDDEGEGAEEFVSQEGVGKERGGVGLVELGAPVSGRAGFGSLSYQLNGRMAAQVSGGGGKAAGDAAVKHGNGCGLLNCGFQEVEERPGPGGVGNEEQAGLGAELPGIGGDGPDEVVGDGAGGVSVEGGRKDDDGVEVAHFGEDGDGVGTGGGGVDEDAARQGGAGEADGTGGGMGDEGNAEGGSGPLEEGENAGREMVPGGGGDDGFRDEFGGSGVGFVGFDDDGVSRGECGGGISSGDGVGEGEVAGPKDDDGADGLEAEPQVRPG